MAERPFEGEVHLAGSKVVRFELTEDAVRRLAERSRLVIPPSDLGSREGLLRVAITLVSRAFDDPQGASLKCEPSPG